MKLSLILFPLSSLAWPVLVSSFVTPITSRISSFHHHHQQQQQQQQQKQKRQHRPIEMAQQSSVGEAAATAAVAVPTMIVGPNLPEIPSTTKRLFLVRHGEVINPGGDRPVYYGAMDVPLSPLGKQEAKAAAQYLAQFDLEHVFSSPLSRAVFGAEEVTELQQQKHGAGIPPLTIMDGFKELDRGDWCGKTKDEIGSDAMAKFDACDESVTPNGGESYPFLKDRVLKARDEALGKMSPGRAAAIVSHLQVTRSILSDAKEIPTSEMANLKIATASVTCIDYDMVAGTQTVHFESFKPDIGLQTSVDMAN